MRREELYRSLRGLDRRGFLRAMGVAAAAGLLPLGCGGVPDALRPNRPLKVLGPRAYATLRAAAERIVGPPGDARIRRGRIDPAAFADDFLVGAPALAGPLEQALLALEFGVFPLLGKWRPFTALAADDRDAILRELAGSRLELKRALFRGVKSVSLLGFYASPESHDLMAYPMVSGQPAVRIEEAMQYPLEPGER